MHASFLVNMVVIVRYKIFISYPSIYAYFTDLGVKLCIQGKFVFRIGII